LQLTMPGRGEWKEGEMMHRHTISLGRLFGIPLELDLSWFLIFALMTWMLAVGYYPVEFTGWPQVEYWLVGAATALMLFVSVVLHELGHSIVAQRYQIVVRRITLMVFGGVSDIATEPPSAGAEFWMAIAGPAVSFALAGILTLLRPAFTSIPPLLALVTYLAYINAILGLFNLIPGFPLDGGRVFRAIIWSATKNLRRATLIAANVGRFIAFGFILIGVWQALTGNLINGIWIAFIGWFLESAAVGQIQQQMLTGLLQGHKVREAMSTQFATVPAEETLQQLVDNKILAGGGRSFVVQEAGEPVGFLTIHQVREVPREQWGQTTARERMMPLSKTHSITPEEGMMEAMKEMDSDGVNQLPVMLEGRMLGLLSRESIITYLRNAQELGY
jgi:Zn-dependent protease/CBS domain-containing protein